MTYLELLKELHRIDEEMRKLSLERKGVIVEYNKNRKLLDRFRG